MSGEWWRGAVIYQIYPRSFKDSNGDGVGDLNGIIQHLDYVAALGVDGIWISPFFKSPMKDFGYDVSDYRDVDPVFGTLDDFHALLHRAHELGLKVLIDQVWSHTSDQHDWFKESRQNCDNARHDWYIWADPKPDGSAPNNWLSWFTCSPAWTWDARRNQYYLHHFLPSQPNLNFWNPDVRQAIRNIALFWLEMGVDGFRLDVANYYYCDMHLRDNPARGPNDPIPDDPPPSNPTYHQVRIHSVDQPETLQMIRDIRALIDQWPDRCLLGEAAGENSEEIAALYTQGGDTMNMAYSFGLLGSDMSYAPVHNAISRMQRVIRDGWTCWAVSNHDFKRVASRVPGEAPLYDKALFATTLGLTLRGSYCLFEGEELGLPQAELSFDDLQDPYDKALYPAHVGRDGSRTPMPWVKGAPHAGFSTALKTWLPVSTEHLTLAVDAQMEDPGSFLKRFKILLQWRKENAVLRLGDLALIEAPAPVLAYRRTYEGKTVVCVFNCSDLPAEISEEGLTGGLEPVRDISHNAEIRNGTIVLKPYGYCIFAGTSGPEERLSEKGLKRPRSLYTYTATELRA